MSSKWTDKAFMDPLDIYMRLNDKFHYEFSFYLSKHINQIIYNQKGKQSTLEFKDVVDFVEETQYLKRYYGSRVQFAHNQAKDRLILLKSYYETSNLLKYEYPMMVINNREDVFLRRHKRMVKISQSSVSSKGSNQNKSQIQVRKSCPVEKDYLLQLDWSQIIEGKFEEQSGSQNQCLQVEFDYDEEHAIYEGEADLKRKEFLRKIGVVEEKQVNALLRKEQNEMSQLVVDFGDLDRENIIYQYQMLMKRQSSQIDLISHQKKLIRMKSVFESSKPLSSSIIVGEDNNSSQKKRKKEFFPDNKQSMLIGSRFERYLQTKSMKKSSQLELNQVKSKHFQLSEDIVIGQKEGQQSPSNQPGRQTKEFYLFPTAGATASSQSQFLTTTFGKSQQNKIMKQSEFLPSTHFSMQRQQQRKQSNDLMNLKEKPFLKNDFMGSFKIEERATLKFSELRRFEHEKEKLEKEKDQRATLNKGLARVKSLQNFAQVEINPYYSLRSKPK